MRQRARIRVLACPQKTSCLLECSFQYTALLVLANCVVSPNIIPFCVPGSSPTQQQQRIQQANPHAAHHTSPPRTRNYLRTFIHDTCFPGILPLQKPSESARFVVETPFGEAVAEEHEFGGVGGRREGGVCVRVAERLSEHLSEFGRKQARTGHLLCVLVLEKCLMVFEAAISVRLAGYGLFGERANIMY
jgi:hypothetical protein